MSEHVACVELWPRAQLAAGASIDSETSSATRGEDGVTTRLKDVTVPRIDVYRPAGVASNMPAVIVCPGGGYHILCTDKEGDEAIEWLNRLGIVGILLRYRVPEQREAAFQDGLKAVERVRQHAKEWGIDLERVGMLGFSAGGHVAARVCTKDSSRAEAAVSTRPGFALLIYPAYLQKGKQNQLDDTTLPVDEETPPTFLAVAAPDGFFQGGGALRALPAGGRGFHRAASLRDRGAWYRAASPWHGFRCMAACRRGLVASAWAGYGCGVGW